jgi:hypothetical protein
MVDWRMKRDDSGMVMNAQHQWGYVGDTTSHAVSRFECSPSLQFYVRGVK